MTPKRNRLFKGIRRSRVVLLGATAVASLVMATHLQKDNAGPGQTRSESSAVPSTTDDWWSGVPRGLAEYEYHPRKNDKGLQVPNRAHNLRTYFEATGIRVQDRTATGSSPNDRIKDLSPGSLVSVGNVPPGGSVSQTWSGWGDREGSTPVAAEAFSGGISLDTAVHALTTRK